MVAGVLFPLLSAGNGADTFPGLLLIAPFSTTDKSQMLVGVGGHFVQWERGFTISFFKPLHLFSRLLQAIGWWTLKQLGLV